MNNEAESADIGATGDIRAKTPVADPHEVTQLLADWSQGNREALEKLMPIVYQELRRLAHRYMEGQRRDHTLQTTALVNEAYLRFSDYSGAMFTDRLHFFAVAAKAMRQILVNYAIAAQRQKRGAGAAKVELDEAAVIAAEEPKSILDLNDALEQLATLDPRKAQVVELKYFGGLKQEEIAELLKVSTVTVRRDWVFAKSWLYGQLQGAA